MKKQFLFFTLLTFSFYLSPLSAFEWKKLCRCKAEQVVVPAPQAATLLTAVESAPKDTLFIFDVGNVLLVHEDAALDKKHLRSVKEWFSKKTPQADDTTMRKLIGIVEQEAKYKLVNASFPEIIQKGQSKGRVVVLSKYFLGPINDQLSFEELRSITLKKSGIELGEPFPALTKWQTEEPKAVYLNGMICTDRPLKGPILLAFLKEVKWKPKNIIFVDDREDQCRSIAAAAKELNIPAQCYRYTEALDNPPQLDMKIAEIQFTHLITTGHWLSDVEASKLINQAIETTACD